MGIDEGFIARVLRTSVAVWGFGAIAFWGTLRWPAALGWTVGSAVSMGLLVAIRWAVMRAVTPDNPRAKRMLVVTALVHWPVLIGVLAAAVWLSRGRFSYIVAFCAGLILTQAVIVLKVVGMLVNQRLNR